MVSEFLTRTEPLSSTVSFGHTRIWPPSCGSPGRDSDWRSRQIACRKWGARSRVNPPLAKAAASQSRCHSRCPKVATVPPPSPSERERRPHERRLRRFPSILIRLADVRWRRLRPLPRFRLDDQTQESALMEEKS